MPNKISFDLLTNTLIGTVGFAASSKGLVKVAISIENEDQFVESLRAEHPGIMLQKHGLEVQAAKAQLMEYFAGQRTVFELDFDIEAGCTSFQMDVLHALAQIPYGETTTYGELAKKVGSPRAARAVGGVMAHNPLPIVLPCHRVLASNGLLGGFGGGIDKKKRLLELEGALLKN